MIKYLILCIACAHATVFFNEPCPEIKAKENFNVSAFTTGDWYEIARYPDDWENRGDCTILRFPKPNVFQLVSIVDNHTEIVQGQIEQAPNSGNTGIMNFNSPLFTAPEGETLIPVYYVAMEYDKYGIAYECRYDKKKNLRHDYAWIISRKQTLDDDSQKKVNEFIKNAHLIDESKFTWLHTSENFCVTIP